MSKTSVFLQNFIDYLNWLCYLRQEIICLDKMGGGGAMLCCVIYSWLDSAYIYIYMFQNWTILGKNIHLVPHQKVGSL